VVRRVVLRAARQNRTPTDADLGAEVTSMRSDAEQFTRVVLGSAEPTASFTDRGLPEESEESDESDGSNGSNDHGGAQDSC
jgi:hypothetical protein